MAFRTFSVNVDSLVDAPEQETTPTTFEVTDPSYVKVSHGTTGYGVYKIAVSTEDLPNFRIYQTTDGYIYKLEYRVTGATTFNSIIKSSNYCEFQINFTDTTTYALLKDVISEFDGIDLGLHAATADRNSSGYTIPDLYVTDQGRQLRMSPVVDYYNPLQAPNIVGSTYVSTDDLYATSTEYKSTSQTGYAYKYLNNDEFDCALSNVKLHAEDVSTITVGEDTYYYWKSDSVSPLHGVITEGTDYRIESTLGYSATYSAISIEQFEQNLLILMYDSDEYAYMYIKDFVVSESQTLSDIWVWFDVETLGPSTTAPTVDTDLTVAYNIPLPFETSPTASVGNVHLVVGQSQQLYNTIKKGNFYKIYGISSVNDFEYVEACEFINPALPSEKVLGFNIPLQSEIDTHLFYAKSATFNGNELQDVWVLLLAKSEYSPIDFNLSVFGGPAAVQQFDEKYIPRIIPAYTASDIGKVLGVVDDGSGNPVLGWVSKT